MTCEICMELLSRFLDEDLTSQEVMAMDEHMEGCANCREVYKDLKEVTKAMNELPDPAMPEEIHKSAMGMIRRIASSKKRGRILAWGGSAAAILVVCAVSIPLLMGSGIGGASKANEMARSQTTAFGGTAVPAATSAPAAAPEAMMGEMSVTGGADMKFTNIAESEIAYDTAAQDAGFPIPPVETGGAKHGLKIERSFSLSVDTAAFDDDLARVTALMEGAGGYYEYRDVSGLPYTEPDGYGRYASMTMRVPVERLDAFVGDLRATGRVMNFYEYANDITNQYYDTQTRLDNYLAQRDKLEELLKRAETVADVLDIQNALTNLQYSIDSLTGQIDSMDGRVSYATVSLSLREIQPKDAILTANPTLGQRISEGFFDAINGLLAFLASAVVLVVAGSPVWIPALAVAFAAFLVIRKLIRGRKPA